MNTLETASSSATLTVIPERSGTPPTPRRPAPAGRWLGPALALALAGPAAADQMSSFLEVEVLGRGYQPGKHYQIGEIDDINTFNGNLLVTVPVGPVYETDGGFRYQLKLIYNSSAWDFETVPSPLPGPQQPCGQSLVQHAYPQQDANAGIGWRLSLGELYSPRPDPVVGEVDRLEQRYPNKSYQGYLFIAPDGRKIPFHEDGSPIHPHGMTVPGVSYAPESVARFMRDGDLATVDTSDGRTYTFFLYDPSAYDGAGSWRLQSIKDVNGNGLDLSFPAGNAWVLTDTNGRSHRVEWSFEDAGDPQQHHLYPQVVSALELAGHGGSVLRYELRYSQGLLAPPPGHDAPDPDENASSSWPLFEYYGDGFDNNPQLPNLGDRDFPRIPLLTELELVAPADTGLIWRFDYYSRENVQSGGINLYIQSGQLASATAPTGATVSWRYGEYLFPDAAAPNCGMPHPCQRSPWYAANLGVVERTVVDPVPSPDLVATWHYVQASPTLPLPPGGNCVRAIPVTTTTVFQGPEAHVYHYNTFTGGYTPPTGSGWDFADFGLPMNLLEQRQMAGIDGPGSLGPHLSLSTEVWGECIPVSASQPLSGDADSAGERSCKKLQEVYTRYQRDVLVPDCTTPGSTPDSYCLYTNRRPAETLTVWFDGAGTETAARLQTPERWDGLGHFRQTTWRSSWNGRQELPTGDVTGWHTRIVTTEYNAGSPDVGPEVPPALPAAGAPWLLETFDRVVETETVALPGAAVQRARTDFCFDHRGRLAGTRVRAAVATAADVASISDPAAGDHDLLVRYTYGGDSAADPVDRGNLVRERLFGGDRQDLGGIVGCADPSSLEAAYRKDHSYRHGVLASTTVVDDRDGQALLTLVDNTQIDRNLRRVERSRAADGLVTTASYDDLGRLFTLVPPGDDAITYIHLPYLGVDQSMRVSTYQGKDRLGDSDPEATKGRTFFDGFGRPYRQWTRMPTSHAWSERFTFYDARGRVVKQSTAHAADQPPRPEQAAYTVTAYDTLGRVVSVRQPDHPQRGSHQLSVVHDGPHLATTHFSVQGGLTGGETGHCTIVKRDPEGRVARAKHAVGCQGAHADNVEVDSYYDVGGRLSQVQTGLQTRLFRYDGLGFLRSERYPELGYHQPGPDPELGAVVYEDYDSLGNPGRVRIKPDPAGSQSFRHQVLRYDRLGRLVQVRDALRPATGQGPGEPITELFYAPANDPGFADVPLRAGRLYQARRHNWLQLGGEEVDLTVTETYAYDDSGRVAERFTRTSLGQVFHQRETYNGLGLPVQRFFPACLDGAACRNEQPFRGAYQLPLNLFYDAGRAAGASWRMARNGAPPAGAEVIRSVGYHWNDLVAEVETDAGVRWVQEIEYANEPAWGLERPSRIFAAGTGFSTGVIHYDGSGNIASMGSGGERFAYDHASRLLAAELLGGQRACYQYDVYGNLTSLLRDAGPQCTGTPIDLAVDPATNQLASIGDAYDPAGSQIRFDDRLLLSYDSLGMPIRSQGLEVNQAYAYTAAGERLVTLDLLPGGQAGRADTWTLRDLGHQLARIQRFENGGWRWEKDYARGAGPVTATRDGTTLAPRYLHPDQLGTPRVITDENGTVVAQHRYLPYGWEITDPALDDEVVKFTGHERDANGQGAAGHRFDDLDYLHARYYTPYLGRFLSVDPEPGAAAEPGSWNRYTYALNNPLRFVDPNGRAPLERFFNWASGTWLGRAYLHSQSDIIQQEDLSAIGTPLMAVGFSVGGVSLLVGELAPPTAPVTGPLAALGGAVGVTGANFATGPIVDPFTPLFGESGTESTLEVIDTAFNRAIANQELEVVKAIEALEAARASDQSQQDQSRAYDRLQRADERLAKLKEYKKALIRQACEVVRDCDPRRE